MKKSIFLVAVLLATACGTTKKEKQTSGNVYPVTEQTTSTEIKPVDPTERPVFHASRTVLTDLINTKLELKPDWEKAYMYGKATITARPHFYSTDSLVLDAKGMTINSVQMNNKGVVYNYSNDVLTIRLDKTYTRNDVYTVVIDYISKPNERKTGGSAAITSDKGLYFINHDGKDGNKMPQIWTQGETESNSVWFPTIDSPNFKSAQEVYITVADKYVTLSNGKLISSKKNADGTRTDYWKQELPHAPYLFMLGIGEFKIVKDSYTKKDGKKIDVFYYVEPEWEQYAKDIFGDTPEMIRFFSEKLGVEYPWDKFHQIVVRDYVSGAMENTGAVVFGDFVYKTKRELLDGTNESIIAHELFHHWFGDLVTAESWSNLPLNEAFANYSQYLWDEYKYGKDEADYNASSEASGYMQQAQMSGYHDLIWYDYDEREQMFDGHSYNKGGRILHMLRKYVGDEAFFLSLNKYLTVNQYKAVEFHQLRLAFEEVTGEDLNWFFQQWFTASGHPKLTIEQRMEGTEVVVNIKQTQKLAEFPIFKLPMQIAVVDDAGKHIHSVVVDKVNNEFRFPVNGTLKTVIPDYQEAYLAEVKEVKPQEQFIQQYYASNEWRTRNKAMANGLKKMTPEAQQLIVNALKDPFWGIRLQAINQASKIKDEALKKEVIATIKQIATNDKQSNVRSAALNFLDNAANNEDLEQLYVDAMKDPSYLVVSAGLKLLGKKNPQRALEMAQSLENESSTNMVVGVAGLYADYGDETKLPFFIKKLTDGSMSGFNELGLMNLLTSFLVSHDYKLFNQAIPVYEHLAKSGGMYTKMFLGQNINYALNALGDARKSIEAAIDEAKKAKTSSVELEAKRSELDGIISKLNGLAKN